MLDLAWKADMGIVAVGTVFPLVFAVQAAYSNRGQAVSALSKIKVDLSLCMCE